MLSASEVKLQIPPGLREEIEQEILRRMRSSVALSADRDAIIEQYALQVDGLSDPFGPGPWALSSQVDDPITLEQVLGQVASLQAQVMGEPRCMVDSADPQDDDTAAQIEAAFNEKLKLWGIDEMLYDVIWNAVSFPFSISHISWTQETRIVFRKQPVGKDGRPIGPGEETKEVVDWVEERVTKNGLLLRSLFPGDFYTYPPNAQKIEGDQACEGVIERVLLTEYALVSGQARFGYEEEPTRELLKAGPTGALRAGGSVQRNAQVRDAYDGTRADEHEPLWECFVYHGRLPLLSEEGRPRLPKHLWGVDFVVVGCPDKDTVFLLRPAATSFRPYDAAHICRYPNRLNGRCVPQMIEPLQEEATAILRETINILEYDAQPVIRKPQSMRNDLDSREIFPGAEIFYPGMDPNIISYLEHSPASAQILPEIVRDLRQRAADLLGAGEGITQIADDRRTATEVNQVGSNASLRKQLFVNMFLPYLARMYQKALSLWLAHLPEGGETLQTEQGAVHVEAEPGLAERFICTPSSNSSAGNPAMRLALTNQKRAILQWYIEMKSKVPPAFWPPLYHAARKSLSEMAERNIVSWLGPEPTAEDVQAAQQANAQAMAQQALAQNAKPVGPGGPGGPGQAPGQNGSGSQKGIPEPGNEMGSMMREGMQAGNGR